MRGTNYLSLQINRKKEKKGRVNVILFYIMATEKGEGTQKKRKGPKEENRRADVLSFLLPLDKGMKKKEEKEERRYIFPFRLADAGRAEKDTTSKRRGGRRPGRSVLF